MEELIESTKELYRDINKCLDCLCKARITDNTILEGEALFSMESLMVSTLQHLQCIIDSIENITTIKWNTNKPTKDGLYLVTFKKLDGEKLVTAANWNSKRNAFSAPLCAYDYDEAVAWFDPKDLKPFTEDDK